MTSARVSKFLRSDIFLVLTVAASCFCFTYLFFGFYYVEYEGLHDALLSGSLTPGTPFDSFYFLMDIGLTHVYSALFIHFPAVDWKSWFYYVAMFISSCLALYVVVRLLPHTMRPVVKVLLLAGVYFLSFADHQIQFLITRLSYVCAGVSLVALIAFFPDMATIRARWLLFLSLNLFFTFGALTRVEPALAVLSLIIFFAPVYVGTLKQGFILLFYPGLLVSCLIVGIFWDIHTSTGFYIRVEPEIETEFMEKGNMVPLSEMKTKTDSAKHQMAHMIMWSDPRVLSPDYLRTLIKPHKTWGDKWGQVCKAMSDISTTAASNRHLVLLALLSGLLVFFRRRSFTERWQILYFLAFELSFWVLILMQTYSVKLNDRSFVPLIGLFIICHVLLFLRCRPAIMSKRFLIMATAIYFIGSIYNFYWLYDEAASIRRSRDIYQRQLEEIKKVAANNIVVINNSSFDCFFLSNTPFHRFDFSAFRRVYVYDAYVIPFIPGYNEYLQHECQCDLNNYPSFWQYLSKAPADVFVTFHPVKLQIVKEYQSVIYHRELDLKEVKVIDPRELILYQLRKEK